jgi:hypothetical protein
MGIRRSVYYELQGSIPLLCEACGGCVLKEAISKA